MSVLAKLSVIIMLLGAGVLFMQSASAQETTATPVPDQGSLAGAIFHTSSDTIAWMSGRATEYAGSPLMTTIAGVMVILLIVGLFMWLRRPKRPLDSDAPM